MSRVDKLKSFARRLMFDRQGPLTRDLLLTPGQFGLGKVPHRLTARPSPSCATSTASCSP